MLFVALIQYNFNISAIIHETKQWNCKKVKRKRRDFSFSKGEHQTETQLTKKICFFNHKERGDNGTIAYNDGTICFSDGTVIYPDGTIEVPKTYYIDWE